MKHGFRGQGPRRLEGLLAHHGGPGMRGGMGEDWDGPHRGGPRGGAHGGPGRGRRGGRARGDIRNAILLLLAEQPRHGYDLMRAIEERSSGAWSPSPGSIYPTLQVLEDEGLLTIETVDGRRTARLTHAGQEWVAAQGDKLAEVFSPQDGEAGPGAIRREVAALAEAAIHVSRSGGPEVIANATGVLAQARADLYRLLADGPAS